MTYAQLDGDGAALHSKLGLSFLRSGLPGAAEREWLRAMELAPKDPSSHFWLGLLASEVGDSARARGYWEEYLRLRPAASAALGRSSGDRSRYPLPWEVFRVEEEASLIHPERSRGRRLLVAISAQVDGSGQESAPGEEWDLRVTDADSWAFGAAGLPEFPPPPGGR